MMADKSSDDRARARDYSSVNGRSRLPVRIFLIREARYEQPL